MTKLSLPVGKADQKNRGWQTSPRHSGIDYGWYNADPTNSKRIYAAAPGVVSKVENNAGWNGGFGNRVFITHASGVETSYNHFWNNGIKVKKGDTVKAGTYLGQMGSTGDSDGEHLHFELWLKGVRVDPAPYFSKDLPGTVAALQPHERQVVSGFYANGRTGPSTAYPVAQKLESGVIGEFQGYRIGQSVDGRDEWLVGKYSGDHFHIGGFTDKSLHDLPKMAALPTTKPTSPTTPTPVTPSNPSNPETGVPYTFKADFPFVTEVIPANRTNWQPQAGRPKAATVVIHQTGTPGVDTYGSTVNTFKNPHSDAPGDAAVSAHFVFGPNNSTQMVALKDRAYGSGSVGNDYIQFEVDAKLEAKTIARVREALEALRDDNGGVPLRIVLHKDIPGNATSCGTLIEPILPQLQVGVVPEPTPVEPEPTPVDPTPTPVDPEPTAPVSPTPAKDLISEILFAILNVLKQIFVGGTAKK